ncbi:DUF4241 domain-containing protein [Bacillus sp. ISL-37]|uniref:DUF4241 domain-containing protein n=1 Tax=Bacillus sp. ISL-37 TaxID=2819123 RepID=UPI001BECE80E|nr:DUF4241 domain-containing protein [Bacillus sp. ISL-37]MBT2682641.1 DUF4241 domain-containing protein [Bacillus sp. ISL-37]
MAKYYEVIDVKEDVAVDFLILENGQDPERIEMLTKPKGAYKLRRVTKESGELTEKMRSWYEYYREQAEPGELIGQVGVDSGMLMISDPCYVKEATADQCERIYETTDNELTSGQILNGLAIALQIGYGDGLYDVLAKRDENGRIIKIEIILD